MTQVVANEKLQPLVKEYMQAIFKAAPNYAAYLGLHEYDGQMADMSAAAFVEWASQQRDLLARLEAVELDPNDKEAAFDKALLELNLKKGIFDIEEIQSYRTNPMFYADVLEVSGYIKRDYAPLEQRVNSMIRQLEQIPDALDHARANLNETLPKPALETALIIYQGVITYLESDVTEAVAGANDADLSSRFQTARDMTIMAVKHFVQFLETRLSTANYDFAIGSDKYRKMLAWGEGVDFSLEKVLEVGERNLAANKAALKEVVAEFAPGKSVPEVMREMGQQHPSSATLVPETIAGLEATRQFLLDHSIVSVPSEVRCLVKESPPFMRWAFASMDAPGPFEQVATQAYYYLTPVEPEWSEQQKEEWLTKFDYFTLQDVSVHEAYPGHYLHFLHTKLVNSQLRQMLYSYSFVEGWAHYVEQMMLEEGFASTNPRFRLAQLSEALLRNSRYVASLKMHTQGMTVDEATRFIMENAYMEETPSRSEAVRGTFDPGYLNYTLGKLLLLKLREDYKREQGANYSLKQFHDTVLSYGAPPVPLLRKVMLQHDDGQIL